MIFHEGVDTAALERMCEAPTSRFAASVRLNDARTAALPRSFFGRAARRIACPFNKLVAPSDESHNFSAIRRLIEFVYRQYSD
jgi:hypothetical protein